MQDAERAMDPETTQATSQDLTETGTLTPASETQGSSDGVPVQNTVASFLMVAGLALACFILLRRLYRRPKVATPEAGMTSRERIEALKGRTEPHRAKAVGERNGLDRCMADAEELTRRLASTLDNKAARIELLIDDAEDAIRRLEEASQRPASGAEPRSSIAMGDSPRLAGRQRLDPTVLDRARLDQLTRERNGLEVSKPESDPPSPTSEGTGEPAVDVAQRVYELADAGNTAVQIARELNQPVGHVELMLNLRRPTG